MKKSNENADRSVSKNPIQKIAEEEKVKKESPTLPEEKDDEGDDEDIRERRGVSCILQDGSLVEMVYDNKKHISKLAKYKDGKVTIEDSVPLNDYTVFMPMSPNQSILENGFILFPSEAIDYESNEALYYEVRAFIEKYVKVSDKFLSVVAVYVMLSWVYDKFQNIPYLRAVGLFGTGKSRLLLVAGHICYKAVLAGGSTSTAAMFRTLDLFKPTLVFDEAELGEKESIEMRQVLRQGYSAGAPVSRMDKGANGKMYIQTFHVFGPKIIASQSDFRDPALESRCLTEFMYPLEEKDKRPIELSKQFKEEALLLRNKLLMFRFKNYGLITADEEALKEIKLPRLRQTGLAIVSVAKMLGLQPLQDVVEFLSDYEEVIENQMTDTVEHDILLCLLDLMVQGHIKTSGKVRIGYDLADRFNQRNYEEYSDKKPSESSSPYNVMKYSSYKVSPKKIGWYVRKMGLRVERDSDGFFIPIITEYPKIKLLARRYRLDRLYVIPDNNMSGVARFVDAETKANNLKLKEEKKKQKEEQEKRREAAIERGKKVDPSVEADYEEFIGRLPPKQSSQS
ncbi:MAG: hypothetical protein Q8P72_07130 [Candidatus Roizmanbacteria bacterium]|nr:hypothetical protein [Candidatus Roizmanbacteria bacterium]